MKPQGIRHSRECGNPEPGSPPARGRHWLVVSTFFLTAPNPPLILLLLITLHSLLLTSSGCASKAKGKTTLAVYQESLGESTRDVIQALQEDFKREPPLGYEEPAVPMMVPPETMLIWVYPERFGDKVFVHGHWVQLVVTPWQWNPEILSNPAGTGSVTEPLTGPQHPEAKPKPQEGQ